MTSFEATWVVTGEVVCSTIVVAVVVEPLWLVLEVLPVEVTGLLLNITENQKQTYFSLKYVLRFPPGMSGF